MKHVFKCEHDADNYIEVSTNNITWDELIADFESYLKACGFELPGRLTVEIEGEDDE